MDIKPQEKSIRDILSSKKQFEIPRFQREYSWEKKHYREFLEDMIGNVLQDGTTYKATPYFMGTMLFVGDKNETSKDPIIVVDGQQRLTTITILFSALSQTFQVNNQTTLSEKMFNYVMAENDDGVKVRVLKTVTSYPYFSYFIQDIEKKYVREPLSEEESSIKETYDYFIKCLQEPNLRLIFKKKGHNTEGISYEDLLKVIRDQVLSSTVIEIITTDKKVANALFEILNAKGKQLSSIDLIKNKIFEVLDQTEPADFAQETWKEIQSQLNEGEERTGIATFLRHYWASKYKSVSKANLYETFKKSIKAQDYSNFLKDLRDNAIIYHQITNPAREDYSNRKEYYWLVQSLNVFRSFFNVVQIRVPLLALLEAKKRGVLDMKNFKQVVTYLENFHFAYTAVLSKGTNRIDKTYSTFAIKLRSCSNKQQVREVIASHLQEPLDKLFPSYSDFEKGFVAFFYTKEDNPCNVKTKYAIFKIDCYYSKTELFADAGSIEHILPEEEGTPLNIGNLILLESTLNVEAGTLAYEAKIPIYQRSSYSWIKQFACKHENWCNNDIEDRAKELAKLYYTKIMGRTI